MKVLQVFCHCLVGFFPFLSLPGLSGQSVRLVAAHFSVIRYTCHTCRGQIARAEAGNDSGGRFSFSVIAPNGAICAYRLGTPFVIRYTCHACRGQIARASRAMTEFEIFFITSVLHSGEKLPARRRAMTSQVISSYSFIRARRVSAAALSWIRRTCSEEVRSSPIGSMFITPEKPTSRSASKTSFQTILP